MRRRDALKALVGLPLAARAYAAPPRVRVRHFGAIPYFSRRHKFAATFGHFSGISKGKSAFLWKYYELASGGPLIAHVQDGEGDCVGQAAGLGSDVLAGCDIFMKFDRERWLAKASVEMIYAGSRVEIGDNKIKGAGSHAEWAVKYLQQYGVLHRTMYCDGTNYINLSGYSAKRSRAHRDSGVPDWLEPFAKKHPIKTYTMVKNARMAFDALYVGQPVVVCCSYAFPDKRDKQGFIKPYTGRWREKWYHAWLLAGFDDTGSRPGGLLVNSHGNWCSGPKRHGQPDGSHWVDAEYLDWMLGEWEDSFALSAYVGHPKRMLDHKLY